MTERVRLNGAATTASGKSTSAAEALIERIRTHFPPELYGLPVWLLWRSVAEDGENPKKIPYYTDGVPRHGTLDGAEDRARLVMFEVAARALLRHPDFTGLGVALGPIEGACLCGIDLDDCYHEGALDERAAQVLAAAQSYAEKSPSGDGLHILGAGDIGTTKKDGRGLEIYSGKRFFTVTGDAINQAELTELADAAKVARALFKLEVPGSTTGERGEAKPAGRILDGGRNRYLSTEAYRLRKQGATVEQIEALYLGQLPTNNLAIAVPPGSGKSRLVSVMSFAWWWTRTPSARFIFASGNPRVSTRDSLLSRQLATSSPFRQSFGDVIELREDQDTKTLFSNTHGGWRMATTTGARTTGDRADILVIDDPIDAVDAFSESAREAAITWYSQAFGDRLSDPVNGKRLLVSQRQNCGDLFGWLTQTQPHEWQTLVIPQEWDESRRYTTALGWTDPRRISGELMFPARFTPAVVEAEKVRLGRSGYAGQHLQLPFAQGGEMFRGDDLQLLDAAPECSEVIISVDTAFKSGQENDFSVAIVLGKFDRGVVILDVVRGKWLYPRLKATLVELAAAVRPTTLVIEDAASGQSLLQDLRDSTALPLVPRKPDGDKISRASSVLPSWESHRVHAVRGAPWLPALLDEVVSFPKGGGNDDQVDSLVMGLRHLLSAPGSGWLQYYGAQLAVDQAAALTTWPVPSQSMQDRAKRDGAVATDLVSPWHRN